MTANNALLQFCASLIKATLKLIGTLPIVCDALYGLCSYSCSALGRDQRKPFPPNDESWRFSVFKTLLALYSLGAIGGKMTGLWFCGNILGFLLCYVAMQRSEHGDLCRYAGTLIVGAVLTLRDVDRDTKLTENTVALVFSAVTLALRGIYAVVQGALQAAMRARSRNNKTNTHTSAILQPPSTSSAAAQSVWECELDKKNWVQFERTISAQLESAWGLKAQKVAFVRAGIAYEADFHRMVQRRVDGKYSTERTIRRHTVDTTACWTIPPTVVSATSRKFALKASDIESAVGREADEFKKACTHFCQVAASGAVTQVDVYESETTRRAFEDTKAEFQRFKKSTAEVWVFHGTSDVNIDSIMTTGFKVGGRDPGVPVANGSSYGVGVYTATGPATPMTYSRRGNKVILARALKGTGGAQGVGDSWEPQADWIVFKDGKQLLPVYVIHYTTSKTRGR
jgi:hypothetical protein